MLRWNRNSLLWKIYLFYRHVEQLTIRITLNWRNFKIFLTNHFLASCFSNKRNCEHISRFNFSSNGQKFSHKFSKCCFNHIINLFIKVFLTLLVHLPTNDSIFTKRFIQRQYPIQMIDFVLKKFRCCCIQILQIIENSLLCRWVGQQHKNYLPNVTLSFIVYKLYTNTSMTLFAYHNEWKTHAIIPQRYQFIRLGNDYRIY